MQITHQREIKTVVFDDIDIPKVIEDAVDALVGVNQKIAAIKLIRGYLNQHDDKSNGEQTCGLKEAKDFVEKLSSEQIRDAARKYLDMTRYARFVLLPEKVVP